MTDDARPTAPRGRGDWPAFPYGAVYFRKSNPPRTDWARDYQVAAEDGANVFRHWFLWSAIEIAPDQFDWADYDRHGIDFHLGERFRCPVSFPSLALAIALVAVLGSGIATVTTVLAISGWVLYARIVRAEVMRMRDLDFVQAARALGATNMRLMAHSILPNIWAPVIVVATFAFAQMTIAEASLSFLGVGIQPPTPTWGGMLSDGRDYVDVASWTVGLPAAALLILVLAVNLLGDWLRDRLDPRLRI